MNSFIENVNYVAGLDNLYGSEIELYKNNLSLKSVQHDIELKFSYYNNDDKKIHSIVHSEPGVLVGGIEDTLLSFKTLVESSITGSEFTCVVNFVINNIVMVNINIVSNSDMYKTYELEMKIVTAGVVTYDVFGEVKDSLKMLPSLAMITSLDVDVMANVYEIKEEIVTVSESIADVETVSDSIANVNTVGNNIGSVNIVGEDIANVNTVSTHISNVDTVSQSITNVNTVSSNMVDVGIASANISNINTVANAQNLADIIRVADDLNSLDVNGIADITIVANDLVLGVDSNIITVSESIDNVNIAGNDIGNINIVGTDIANVDIVSTNINDINITANDIVSINSVSSSIADVNTVSDGIINVNTVSGSIANVNTVASNIVGLNSIVSNITEILLADDNAAIATTKALESSDSAYASLQSATDAAVSAASALSSATTATTKANEASVSVTSAATYATNANTSATQSATSAWQSATSASSAASSATDANTSKLSAVSSADAASASAVSANQSALDAIEALDEFTDIYLGRKVTAPTVDNDGNALVEGTIYWNTTSKSLFIHDGTMWDPAVFDVSGTVTSFNGRDGAVTLTNSDVTGATGQDLSVVGTPSFASVKVTGRITEQVYNLTGTAINPANGTIQYKTVSANTTFTETLTSGQSVLLRLIGASNYTTTFPTITWVGAAAPTLTANCAIVIWKEQSTLYGSFVGTLV